MKGSGLSQVRARRVVAELEDERPWYTKEEYLEALCSLITLFPSEVSKPTAQAGKTVRVVLGGAIDVPVEQLDIQASIPLAHAADPQLRLGKVVLDSCVQQSDRVRFVVTTVEFCYSSFLTLLLSFQAPMPTRVSTTS